MRIDSAREELLCRWLFQLKACLFVSETGPRAQGWGHSKRLLWVCCLVLVSVFSLGLSVLPFGDVLDSIK